MFLKNIFHYQHLFLKNLLSISTIVKANYLTLQRLVLRQAPPLQPEQAQKVQGQQK